jgi:flagella basal body P-ring formation protein FlgA
VLRAGDLGKPDVVSRGEIVTVVYEIPGMMLTLRGRATEAGAQGESIGILNIQSKKTLQATVAGPGKVSIAAPIPGPLAANTVAQAANR